MDRAIACIEEHDGAIDETLLIARVFGNATNAALWRPLLRNVLAQHPAARLRPDGLWTTRTTPDVVTFPDEFVVLDVETTGLKPSHQRVIEVGLIRVSPHGSPLRWSSLVNPGRKVPDYIRTLTSIDDHMLAGAPEFRSIAPTIVEIIGDLPVIGHNVEFDLAFVNAEMVRAGLPKLVNQSIDTLALASTLVSEARRLNLGDVARALGVQSKEAHRALADASTTLDVFGALLARARTQGLTSLDDLTSMNQKRRAPVPVQRPVGRARSILDRGHLDGIPHAPGVYIMRDGAGSVIYVGKARDLRKRVSSYYSQPLGYTRKMDGLIQTLERIDVEVVGCELEALVLESQLIRRYRPRFNVVQRNVEQYVYVRVDVSNPWPRVTVARDRANDGATYFGPFRAASSARKAVALVNDTLPLRTCRRSFMDKRSYGSPCLELSLNRCLGPCIGQADPELYREYVYDVLEFFRGDDRRLIKRLHTKLEDTVASLDFERAATLRDRIKQVETLAREQRGLDDVAQHRQALLVLPGIETGTRTVWYLLNGRRWAALTVNDDETARDLAVRFEPIHQRATLAADGFLPDHHAVDEMAILARWMRRTPNHEAYIPLDDRTVDDGCIQILGVDLSVPFGEGSGGEEADDTGATEYDSVATVCTDTSASLGG
ncbi:MAG: exonuclease domain-containing protein [Thermomicrobiales bacterium]|nr:exonuclease domain-containing protein [Thermomicrobiales bacterium]